MVKQVSAVKEDTIQAIKDGQPSLVGNMIVINAVLEEMLTNNDKCNASMLAAARRLVLEAHDQLDTLIALIKRGYPDYSREALVKFVNKYLTDDILVVGPDGPEIDLLRLYCPNSLDGFEYSRFYPLPKKYVPAFNALLGETNIAEEETAALFYQLVAFDRNADTLTTCYRRYFTDYDGDFCNRRTAAKKGSRALAELGLLVPYNEWDTDCISSKSVFTWLVSAIDYNNPKRLFNWPQCDSAALAACCEEHPRIKQYMQAHTRDVDGWPITDSPLADLAKAIFLKDGDLVVTV